MIEVYNPLNLIDRTGGDRSYVRLTYNQCIIRHALRRVHGSPELHVVQGKIRIPDSEIVIAP